MTPTVSRRTLLGAAAAGAAGSMLPFSVQEALARPAPRGGLGNVKHVILLMQENRSFDHYFGTMAGVRGFGDTHPLTLRTTPNVFHQPNPGVPNSILPFSLRDLAATEKKSPGAPQYLGTTPHSFPDAVAAIAQGWWDNWPAAKTETTMAYLDRRDLALQTELAQAFTVCDAYHCSLHGGTNPNRNFFWTGMTGYESDGRRAVMNDAYGYDHPGYTWTTYPERLEQAGVSWQIYQEWDNYTDNAVEYFRTFKDVGRKILAHVTPERFRTTEEMYDKLNEPTTSEADRTRILGMVEKGRAALTPAERSLFDRAMYRSRPGTLLQRIADDIAADRLPQVVWVVPPSVDSEHPSVSEPLAGAHLIHGLLDRVASHRPTWDSTITLINFDENDGLFDHVPSPLPPRDFSDEWWNGQPIGLGPRVPMTVISPWSVGGVVSSEVFDHTSTLRLLEHVTGVKEPQINAWRRTVCGDLTGTLDFSGVRPAVQFDTPDPVPPREARWNPDAPERQAMPNQAGGRAPARELPYRPEVSSRVTDAELLLTLANRAATSTHFTVYSFTGVPATPVHVDVAGGQKEVRIPLVGGAYRVSVQGPNRFWVDLAGTASGAAAHVAVGLEPRMFGKKAHLQVGNEGSNRIAVEIADERYGSERRTVQLSGRGTRTQPWHLDEGWYDVTITSPDDPTFTRRLTGRIENGRPGVTA